jgi:hypothetical protein
MSQQQLADAAPRKKADRTPRSASPNQRLLTGTQVEQEFGVPYRSTYDLYANGKLPAVRFTKGGRLWFRREDIEALITRSLMTA